MIGSRSRLLAITTGFVLLLIGLAQAEDDRGEPNAFLKGTFRFSTVKTCTDVVIGSIVHFHFNGTIIYDGAGSATLSQQGMLVLPGSTPLSFEERAELTYLPKPNGGFIQEGTFIAADHSYTVTGTRMIGQIDAQGSVVMLSGPMPSVKETVTSSAGGVSQYFCGASGTAVRIR